MKPDDPAFPGVGPPQNNPNEHPGMSIRTYIATATMKGLLSNSALATNASFAEFARDAVRAADALLERLEEKP